MITTNVIHRVFHLHYGDGYGTCFAIDVSGKQYLVTAKHLIENFISGGNIELWFEGGWISLPANLIGHHPSTDVSVISIGQILATFEMQPTSAGLTYGQDVFFLGFPYGLKDDTNSNMNRNFPLPFVKKALLSAMATSQGENGYYYLDGHNNRGFSGGPMVFKAHPSDNFKVAGIISAYRVEEKPIYNNEGTETESYFKDNTGLILAYDIKNALSLISANPIGCPLG